MQKPQQEHKKCATVKSNKGLKVPPSWKVIKSVCVPLCIGNRKGSGTLCGIFKTFYNHFGH